MNVKKRRKIVLVNFILLFLLYSHLIWYFIITWEAPSIIFGFNYANYGSLYISSDWFNNVLGLIDNELVVNAIYWIVLMFNPIITIIIMNKYVSKYYEKNIFIPFFITLIIGLGGSMCMIINEFFTL